MSEFNINDYKKRMLGAIENMKENFQGLRSGRASSALVDNITVDAYGQSMKIKDIASVNVPESRSLKINVWDANLVNSVEKAIIKSSLELTPASEGQVIRINLRGGNKRGIKGNGECRKKGKYQTLKSEFNLKFQKCLYEPITLTCK